MERLTAFLEFENVLMAGSVNDLEKDQMRMTNAASILLDQSGKAATSR